MSKQNENYPLAENEYNFQKETDVSHGYNIEDNKMPTIDFSAGPNKAVEKSTPSTSDEAIRERYDVSPSNPETNMHDQFVDENAITKSEGAVY